MNREERMVSQILTLQEENRTLKRQVNIWRYLAMLGAILFYGLIALSIFERIYS